MMPRCPFVPLAESSSIQQLYRDKPFLCSSILAVSTWSHPALQRDLSHRFLDTINQHSFKESIVSLDVLQALLIFLTWYVHLSRLNRTVAHRIGLIVNLSPVAVIRSSCS